MPNSQENNFNFPLQQGDIRYVPLPPRPEVPAHWLTPQVELVFFVNGEYMYATVRDLSNRRPRDTARRPRD